MSIRLFIHIILISTMLKITFQNIKAISLFHKYNFDTENDSPGQGEHKSALKCIVDGLVFAGDEIEISLAPSLLVTFLRHCGLLRRRLPTIYQRMCSLKGLTQLSIRFELR